jgi:EPS-associated MarR family transcriptional regulator
LKELGLSLGKVNFCLRALADIGLIKAKRFYKSQSKRSYLYILTPKGVKEKAKITMHFLAKKQHEYELLRLEIQKLQKEADKLL